MQKPTNSNRNDVMTRTQQMEYVRQTYGVPADKGKRVRFTGSTHPMEGTIIRAKDGRLVIHLDGNPSNWRGVFHPTWKLEYL